MKMSILLCIVMAFTDQCFAESDAKTSESAYKAGPYEFLLPTHLANNPQKKLIQFDISTDFRCHALVQKSDPYHYTAINYIPDGENLHDWSEQIGIDLSAKIPQTLDSVMPDIKAYLEEQFSPEQVNSSLISLVKEENLEVAVMVFDHPAYDHILKKLIPGQRQNQLQKFILGKNELACTIQYSVRYSSSTIPKRLQEKQKSFIENCKILSYEECGLKTQEQPQKTEEDKQVPNDETSS